MDFFQVMNLVHVGRVENIRQPAIETCWNSNVDVLEDGYRISNEIKNRDRYSRNTQQRRRASQRNERNDCFARMLAQHRRCIDLRVVVMNKM